MQNGTARLFRVALAASLSVSALLFFVWSWRWPLVGDASLIHYIGWLIGRGWAPYRQIGDMNMPGSYLIEMAAMHLFGMGDLAWRLFDFALMGADGRVILRDYAMRGRPILRGAIAKGGTGRWMACRPLRRMPLYPDPRPRRPGRGRAARPDDGGVPDRCDGLPVCRNPQRLAVGGGGLRALLRCGADHQAHRSAADCGATSAGALCSARAWKARRIAEPWLAAPCGGCHSGLSHRSGSRAHFPAAGAGACRLLRQSSRTRSLLLRAGTSPAGIPAAAQRLAPAASGFALAGGAGATPSEAGLGACSTGLRRALRTGSPTWFRRADFRTTATRCSSSCCR